MNSNNQQQNRLHKIINSTNQPVNNFKKSILYELSSNLNEDGAVIQNVPKFRMKSRDFELMASAKRKESHQSQVILRVVSPLSSRRPSASIGVKDMANGNLSTSNKKPKNYLSALLTPLSVYSVYSECK
jgi:hypothetical protein